MEEICGDHGRGRGKRDRGLTSSAYPALHAVRLASGTGGAPVEHRLRACREGEQEGKGATKNAPETKRARDQRQSKDETKGKHSQIPPNWL